MNSPLTTTPAYAIELDKQRSQQLLERAIDDSAEVSVLPHTRVDGLPVHAVITGCTDEGLLIRPQDPALSPQPSALSTQHSALVSLVSVYCEATIHLEGARLLFSTNIIDVCEEGDGVRLEIAKPTHLHVVQRRRYQRRDLHGRTPVRITPTGCEDRPALEATLLNISTGGLACRTDRTSAEMCGADSPVKVEFTVADCAEVFHMPAQIRGKTPGASGGQIIISLEFASGTETEAQREKLADALYSNLVALTGG